MMHGELKRAIKETLSEMRSMSDDEFNAMLEKYKDGNTALMLLEAGL